jgi:hypothetical protein
MSPKIESEKCKSEVGRIVGVRDGHQLIKVVIV